jgi:hypothetical protein
MVLIASLNHRLFYCAACTMYCTRQSYVHPNKNDRGQSKVYNCTLSFLNCLFNDTVSGQYSVGDRTVNDFRHSFPYTTDKRS